MKFVRALYSIAIDALFPLTPAEAALARMSPDEALRVLPPAPPYDGSVVPLPRTHSVLAYKDERVSKLVWSIKYKKNAHAVKIGSHILWNSLRDMVAVGSADTENVKFVIIPTPITGRRRRERGYNQCELLLDEIQRLDTRQLCVYEKHLLVRTVHKNRQTLKSREERLSGTEHIFGIDREIQTRLQQDAAGKKLAIIVIDDVITTGSTLRSALDVLQEAGFTDVRGLSLAH